MGKINKKVIFNTIKLAGAAIAAIVIASALNMDFAVSAGIVAILTIQPTKKETVRTALGRLMAFISALLIAYVAFETFGYGMTAFMAYLIVFIFICQIFNWYSAITMNSVLISHFLTSGNMSVQSVGNEVMIFAIGVGVGIIANMHLRKNVDYIEELKNSADKQIKQILMRMSKRILNHDLSDYNGECFFVLRNHIRKAKNVAEENYNNQLRTADVYDIEYIRMRDKQCWVLYEMYKSIRNIDTAPITSKKISDFLFDMARFYHEDNGGKALMEEFWELDRSMKKAPLPTERKEFEDRARLFGLLRHIEEFIQIKIDFYDKYAVKR